MSEITYPTQWAYAQACAALDKHRTRADTAEADLAEMESAAADWATRCQALTQERDALRQLAARLGTLPTIVCLCGSTRFYDTFRQENLRLTLEGKIVLSIGCDTKADGDIAGIRDLAQVKADLDKLHRDKIRLADEVLVLNVGGYVGDSTRGEIEYAAELGKPVRYLEAVSDAPVGGAL